MILIDRMTAAVRPFCYYHFNPGTMGRERKPQTGATNLSARSASHNQLPAVASAAGGADQQGDQSTADGSSKVALSLAHKLIAPDLFKPTKKNDDDVKKLKVTATWTPATIYKRDFETIHSESFQNPKNFPQEHHRTKSTKDIAEEAIKTRGEVEAIQNMCKLVRASYGTVATMLRSFHKKPTDNFSLFEFGEYLKRNKLEGYLNEIERRKIFDHIDEKHDGNVPVKDFLKKVEEYEFLGHSQNQDMQRIRDFLALQLHDTRDKEDRKTGDTEKRKKRDEELEKLKQTKGVENEVERMKKALGMKTYDLDFHPEELDEVLESTFNKLPTTESQRKYARFLHHSNLKLAQIPFYDMRSTEIDRLKHKAVEIDKKLASDEIMGRFKELSKTRWNGSAATINYLDSTRQLGMTQQQADDDSLNNSFENSDYESENNNNADIDRKVMQLSKSMPNLSVRPSPLYAESNNNNNNHSNNNNIRLEPMSPQQQPPQLTSVKSAPKILEAPKQTKSPVRVGAKNLTNDKGLEYDEMSSVPSITVTHSEDASALLSNMPPSLHGAKSVASLVASLSASQKAKPVSKLRTGLLDQEEKKLQASDFFTQIIDESSSMGRLKNPAAVFRIEKVDPNVYEPSCRRVINQGPTDWTRVGIGGDHSHNERSHSHDTFVENDRYLTTTDKFYPPLIYEPSQPVQRDIISDAELVAHKKAYIRSQRYARKMANMEVTRTRLEYEAIQKEIRSLNRQQSRIEDNIRYKTNVFIDDLQQFRTQPLQRMAKRQNIELSDRMWNGSADKQTVQLVKDERDFRSTYNSSFDANVVKDAIQNTAKAINDKLHGTGTFTETASSGGH